MILPRIAAILALACAIVAPALAESVPDLAALDISGGAVVAQLQHLATFSDDPNPAVTRILFTGKHLIQQNVTLTIKRFISTTTAHFHFSSSFLENDLKARAYVKQLMQDAGLIVTQDSMGSIFGTLHAADGTTDTGVVATGSHCDAIPLAGMYDGTLGVIGGIAAIKALKEAGFRPARPLRVIFFTSEEPTRFGLSCLGSRAMAGTLSTDELAALRDVNGTSFLAAAAAASAGAKTVSETLAAARIPEGQLSAFLELHIEQGPELEAEGVPIGVVTAIAAPAALRVSFHGDGGHAGGQLMPRRNDASLAAAELALAIEAAAVATGAPDTVATAGRWEVAPNAVNSVPRDATLEIDVRDVDLERRDGVVATIKATAAEIASRRRVRHSITMINSDPPATSDSRIVNAVEDAARSLGLKTKAMPSRAYHDALFMAQVAPTGMVFIPCANGWSHRPDEFAAEEDIERGVRVLAGALAALAGGETESGGREEL